MKFIFKIMLVFIAISAALSVAQHLVLLLKPLSAVFAAACAFGAAWGAFRHHGHGKPLLYGAIEGASWLPKKTFELIMVISKFVFRLVMPAGYQLKNSDQWFVSSQRQALGPRHIGGGRYYQDIEDLAIHCKAFAALPALIHIRRPNRGGATTGVGKRSCVWSGNRKD